MATKPSDEIVHNGEPKTVTGVAVYRALGVEPGTEMVGSADVWPCNVRLLLCLGDHLAARLLRHRGQANGRVDRAQS